MKKEELFHLDFLCNQSLCMIVKYEKLKFFFHVIIFNQWVNENSLYDVEFQ